MYDRQRQRTRHHARERGPIRRHRRDHSSHVGGGWPRHAVQLSDATGLSISAVQSRVQKLERRDVILGYKAVIDDERRGLAVRAYIAVTPIDYSKESEIPDKLQDIDGIMSCDSVAGSPSYMLTVRAASPGKLEDLLNVIHQTVPVSTETTIVLQRYFSK